MGAEVKVRVEITLIFLRFISSPGTTTFQIYAFSRAGSLNLLGTQIIALPAGKKEEKAVKRYQGI